MCNFFPRSAFTQWRRITFCTSEWRQRWRSPQLQPSCCCPTSGAGRSGTCTTSKAVPWGSRVATSDFVASHKHTKVKNKYCAEKHHVVASLPWQVTQLHCVFHWQLFIWGWDNEWAYVFKIYRKELYWFSSHISSWDSGESILIL